MDNHLAAGWCWLHHLPFENSFGFCHIDQHDDLVNNRDIVEELSNPDISLDDYLNLAYPSRATLLPPIKKMLWDNYIMRVKHVNPHWFTKEIYACHSVVSGERCDINNEQKYVEEFDIDKGFIKIPILPNNPAYYDLFQDLTDYLTDDTKWIVNLDIDYFFKKPICIFSDKYIIEVAKQILDLKDRIAVLTIAISPECCGGWENGKRVYNLIAETLGLKIKL